MPASNSADRHLSAVERGKSKRMLGDIAAELEALHNFHHSWTEDEIAHFTMAVQALAIMEARLAKAPRT